MNTSILTWICVAATAGLAMTCGCLSTEVGVVDVGAKDVEVEDASVTGSGVKDAAAKDTGAKADEGPETDGPICTPSSDCGLEKSCLFVSGDCSAIGHCLDLELLGAQCASLVTWCGCDGDGGTVQGICGLPYAYGPTNGKNPPTPEDSCGGE
jgi:hypothetical protein